MGNVAELLLQRRPLTTNVGVTASDATESDPQLEKIVGSVKAYSAKYSVAREATEPDSRD